MLNLEIDTVAQTYGYLEANYLMQNNERRDRRRIIAAMKATAPEYLGADTFEHDTIARLWIEQAERHLLVADDDALPDDEGIWKSDKYCFITVAETAAGIETIIGELTAVLSRLEQIPAITPDQLQRVRLARSELLNDKGTENVSD